MVNETQMNPMEGKQEEGGKAEEIGFKELYEQSLQSLHMGEIVTGRVVQITADVVMVDVGWKTEGYVPIKELRDRQGNLRCREGEEIEVLVDRRDQDGNLVLSWEKANWVRVWDRLKAAYDEKDVIKGTIVEKVKGGFSVDIGVPAFLPGSHLDVRPVKDVDRFVGQTLDFHILKYDRKRNNVVLSRKTVLEEELERKKRETLANISEGKILEGTIKNITDYGIFIDLGGLDGLLHVTDVSWGRVGKLSDLFRKGDRITVKVLSFDPEKERVSLGLKQLTEDPWINIKDKYHAGDTVEGKVVNITDYGVFVELEPGVEGLIHISEMFWTREIKHPSKVVTPGQMVKVKVLEVNEEAKRISLGLKQTMPNPWEKIKEKYPEGSIVKGVVRNVTSFGIFVGVEEGIDGLIHLSDISWKKKIKHPAELFKKGQEIEAMVLKVDVENEKFSLGLKQLEKDPWEEFAEKCPPGSVVQGKVTNVTEFGVFVEVGEGIEGLIHISELSHKRIKSASELYSAGDEVSASVKSIDTKNRKIRLSIKELQVPKEQDQQAVKQYLNNREKLVSNLGQVLADVKFPGTE
ncbi:MAG TPA: 30S ribosomal protein S1 [Syntrophales bacterium]|nr:30S ribosomal protein S1 [Syntrophales bacterium]HOL59236.1 30S ribosomal protein S1 [Syntrophales bacterium]HPO35286.1 30S ribosomal protein S1 [Syntrophales bacterium]